MKYRMDKDDGNSRSSTEIFLFIQWLCPSQTVTWTGQGDQSPPPNFVPSHIGKTLHFPK